MTPSDESNEQTKIHSHEAGESISLRLHGCLPEVFVPLYMHSRVAELMNSEWNKMYGESTPCAYDYFIREVTDKQKAKMFASGPECDKEALQWIGYAYSVMHWQSGLEADEIYRLWDFKKMYDYALKSCLPPELPQRTEMFCHCLLYITKKR